MPPRLDPSHLEAAAPAEAELLRKVGLEGEEWLIDRVLHYARQQGYARYTSTLREAWRISIAGLSASLLDSLDRFGCVRELSPDEDFAQDPIAAFGILEAGRHRERGVSLEMFLGLTRYYRQAYTDLVEGSVTDPSSRRVCRLMVERFYDRVELGFTSEWLRLSETVRLEELRDANRRMTNEKNRYLTIFESIGTPVLLVDAEGDLCNLNHAAAETFVGEQVPGSFYYGRQWARQLPWLARVLRDHPLDGLGESTFDLVVETTQGLRRFEGRLAPMLDVSRKFDGTVVILNDVTEREAARAALQEARDGLEDRVAERTRELSEANRQLQTEIEERRRIEDEKERIQDQLLHAQKMEAVGTLAGGVAHDLNNLLQVVMGNSELIALWGGDQPRVQATLGGINVAVERCAALVRQLLVFSRKEPVRFQQLDLNRVVAELLKMVRRLIGPGIQVVSELDPELAGVRGDAGSLEQVLMNLVVNARDAMPDGGVLRIRTENVVFDAGRLPVPEARPGPYVRLWVEDDGCGMDAATLARVFEPYFTTKAALKGTGLGLSVVYGIVQRHDGWIRVDSQPGSGTAFQVCLPAIPGVRADGPEAGPSLEALRGAGEHVLVVDDDPDVRSLTADALAENGYRVTEARDAEAATLALRAGSFDLVLTDVVLPGRSGPDLARAVWSHRPEQRFLFVSGYTAGDGRWAVPGQGDVPALAKPYALRELLAAVRAALAAVQKRSGPTSHW